MRAGAIQTPPPKAPSPLRAAAITVAAIFATEAAIMLLLARVPELPVVLEAVLDPLLLSVVTIPVVYVTWFRPLKSEIEQHARASQSLEAQALTDSLTELPNRLGFLELLRKELQHAARVQGAFTVVVLDLRRFGEVNGALGHDSGDQLLKLVGERLRSSASALGAVARLGSDQFGVLLAGVDLARAAASSEQLHQLVEMPLSLGEAPIEIEAHLGYAAFPQHGDAANLLLQRAELALQRAKKAGERGAAYREENESQARRRLEMVRWLRHAISAGELSLVYQPKIGLSAGQFTGAEALVRWTHPELGLIPPGEFVPLAEQTNLIRPLTLWVLEEAVRQIAAWKSGGLELTVSVNLSARNLSDETLPERVRELLGRWNVDASCLTVEVTESAVLAEPERAADVLERFRALGIAISIDDFGTGYSSLTYLRTMPASELKIDRSFVRDLEASDNDASIVRAVIGLAHSLGLKVVCEGVESEASLLRLRQLGCDFAQGYFISRPLSAPALLAFAADRATRAFAANFDPRAGEVRQPRLSLVPGISRPPLRESLRAIRIVSAP